MQSINLTKEAKCNNLSCQYVDGFRLTIVADGFIMQNWMDYDVRKCGTAVVATKK